MDRQKFILEYRNFLSETGLAARDVRVTSGGALLMLGLREQTSDLDLEVFEETFTELVIHRGLRVVNLEHGSRLASWNHCVDLHPVDDVYPGRIVSGVWIAEPEEILRLKLELNRPKDQEDIRKLHEYLTS